MASNGIGGEDFVQDFMGEIVSSTNRLADTFHGTPFSNEIGTLKVPSSLDDFTGQYAPALTSIFRDFTSGFDPANHQPVLEGLAEDIMPADLMQGLYDFGSQMKEVLGISENLDVEQDLGSVVSSARSIAGAGLDLFHHAAKAIVPVMEHVEQLGVQAAAKTLVPMVGEMVDSALASENIDTGGLGRQFSQSVTPLIERLSSNGVSVANTVALNTIGNVASHVKGEAEDDAAVREPASPEVGSPGSSPVVAIVEPRSKSGAFSSFEEGHATADAAYVTERGREVVLSESGASVSHSSSSITDIFRSACEELAKGTKGTELGDNMQDIASRVTSDISHEMLGDLVGQANKALENNHKTFENQAVESFGAGASPNSSPQLEMFKGLESVDPAVVPGPDQVVGAIKRYWETSNLLKDKVDQEQDLPEKLKLAVTGTVFLAAQTYLDEKHLADPIIKVIAPIAGSLTGGAVGESLGASATGSMGGADLGLCSVLGGPVGAAVGGASAKALHSFASQGLETALQTVKSKSGEKFGVDAPSLYEPAVEDKKKPGLRGPS